MRYSSLRIEICWIELFEACHSVVCSLCSRKTRLVFRWLCLYKQGGNVTREERNSPRIKVKNQKSPIVRHNRNLLIPHCKCISKSAGPLTFGMRKAHWQPQALFSLDNAGLPIGDCDSTVCRDSYYFFAAYSPATQVFIMRFRSPNMLSGTHVPCAYRTVRISYHNNAPIDTILRRSELVYSLIVVAGDSVENSSASLQSLDKVGTIYQLIGTQKWVLYSVGMTKTVRVGLPVYEYIIESPSNTIPTINVAFS